MGIGGAEWLERSEREIEELPETALDKIGIRPGMVVADVGAGVGYFSVRVGKRIGPQGKGAGCRRASPRCLQFLGTGPLKRS